uniref:TANC1/2-like AAA+ ATPase lid domain-containing protein n=1 Tax=Knipowitschia caucasica TaxID=637954 RepID=A0AAV2MHC4_KNICA
MGSYLNAYTLTFRFVTDELKATSRRRLALILDKHLFIILLVFLRCVLVPLLSVKPPQQALFLLVDSIDEGCQLGEGEQRTTPGSPRTIAELLAAHHDFLPPWLLLICSARRQNKAITKLFTGFRKISLDDLRKAYIVKDVQQYILHRLDQEEALRQHLTKETAEMLNQLHIKSSGCFLYLERVLDGVVDNFIMLREIRDIPGTLNGLQGHTKVVNCLIGCEANINHTDHDGWTALRSAAWGGHSEVVSALLYAGAKVNCADADGRTALRAAAWGGHEDIVLNLLQHGAEVNKADNEGRTALIAAAYMGHREIVEHLLDHGAEVNHEDVDGRTALSVAALCIPASKGHASVVSLLIERGAEVDHCDKDCMTPLLVAGYEGHVDVVDLLLEGGADVDHTDNNGRTPLLAAASMGHASVVNALLFWGAAVDSIDSEGRTVLSIASAQGNVEVVRTLLDRGLDENHRDDAGWTPLHMAAFEGHRQVCDALIEQGARGTEVDNDGNSFIAVSDVMDALIVPTSEGMALEVSKLRPTPFWEAERVGDWENHIFITRGGWEQDVPVKASASGHIWFLSSRALVLDTALTSSTQHQRKKTPPANSGHNANSKSSPQTV